MRQIFLLLIICVICNFTGSSQDFRISNDVAFVNDTAYVKVVKSKKKQYRIFNLESGEQLLIINMSKAYNRVIKEKHMHPTVFFVEQKQNIIYEYNIQTDIGLVSFLYNQKLISIDGNVNEKQLVRHLNYINEN